METFSGAFTQKCLVFTVHDQYMYNRQRACTTVPMETAQLYSFHVHCTYMYVCTHLYIHMSYGEYSLSCQMS